MKESHNEGVASHIDPESCLDDPRGRGEALTGGSAGGLLSSENTNNRGPILLCDGEGETVSYARARVADRPSGALEPAFGVGPR